MENSENYSTILEAFNNEILQLQKLYNLHPIEIYNIFNDALKNVYTQSKCYNSKQPAVPKLFDRHSVELQYIFFL